MWQINCSELIIPVELEVLRDLSRTLHPPYYVLNKSEEERLFRRWIKSKEIGKIAPKREFERWSDRIVHVSDHIEILWTREGKVICGDYDWALFPIMYELEQRTGKKVSAIDGGHREPYDAWIQYWIENRAVDKDFEQVRKFPPLIPRLKIDQEEVENELFSVCHTSWLHEEKET